MASSIAGTALARPQPGVEHCADDGDPLATPNCWAVVVLADPREAGLVTKRIQGAKGYTQLRKEDVDRRFPGLLDSVINADVPALV